MDKCWFLLLALPLGVSCMVPMGYTPGRAKGMVSDSPSAQYLQLSLDYLQKGLTARDQAGGDAEAAKADLKALAAQFQTQVDEATKALDGDPEIPLGDDSVVLRKSLAGASLAEVLQRSATARGLEGAAADQDAEYRKVVAALGASRGLYLSDQAVWPQNTVNYRWASSSNPSPAHRAALEAAMDAWVQASGGRLHFHELETDAWTEFQLAIAVKGCVVFLDGPLEAGIAGRATLGYQAGANLGYLKLLPNLQGISLRRTSLHEMGHVLGLIHEHKRPDRDTWINVGSAGYSLSETDMGALESYSDNLRWTPVQVRFGAWSITLFYPVWWKVKVASEVGTFDMKSIMIYSGFQTLKDWSDPDRSTEIPAGDTVPWNTELSEDDVTAIRALYP